jgi:enoyl-CoA hydratase/carnithine racemase
LHHSTLTTEIDDGILLVTLNRGSRLNAFSVEMGRELEELFARVNEDNSVLAIIVIGAGQAFCAGMDLSRPGNVFGLDETLRPNLDDLTNRLDDPEIHFGVRDSGGRVALAIHDCLKPVIAAINGPAIGIGATMTLAMDFRLATESARIGFVFGKLGIVPEACSSWFLPRLVGQQIALEWMLTADVLSAEAALRGGLLRSVHPSKTELIAEAKALARRIVSDRSPVAIAMTRAMIRRNWALPHPLDAHRIDSLAMFYTSISDGKEGVAAFLEKRKPNFSQTYSDIPDAFIEAIK